MAAPESSPKIDPWRSAEQGGIADGRAVCVLESALPLVCRISRYREREIRGSLDLWPRQRGSHEG